VIADHALPTARMFTGANTDDVHLLALM